MLAPYSLQSSGGSHLYSPPIGSRAPVNVPRAVTKMGVARATW